MTIQIEKEILSPEQIQNYCYRISTSHDPFAFSKDDGTLVSPNVYERVGVKELLRAQISSLIEKGWKSPEEINAMVAKFDAQDSPEIGIFEKGIKEGRRQSRESVEKVENPNKISDTRNICELVANEVFEQARQTILKELE